MKNHNPQIPTPPKTQENLQNLPCFFILIYQIFNNLKFFNIRNYTFSLLLKGFVRNLPQSKF